MKKTNKPIPFNWPYISGNEINNILQAHSNGVLAGDGPFTKQCHLWLEQQTGCPKALLTHSCTAALEMAALLINILPGDEIIMPSYTFVSTANAFVLRGGIPVFVDIREDTLNLNEQLIESAITSRTKAIVPVHYAGVGCEMDFIMNLAEQYDLKVIEDAAQALMSSYKGCPLGSIGDLGAYSFHETKNIISGEGGALSINKHDLVKRSEIIRDKGTDRSSFIRGEVDKYTWQEIGSSYLPGELIAAFLFAQFEHADQIIKKRIKSWEYYHQILKPLEHAGLLRRPIIPEHCEHNAHMYYVILAPEIDRNEILAEFKKNGIGSFFHYIPLHSSPAGKKFGRAHNDLKITNKLSNKLIRLPLWNGLKNTDQDRVIDLLGNFLAKSNNL